MNNIVKKNSVIEVIVPSKRGRGIPRPAVVLSILGDRIGVVVCTAHPKEKRLVEIPSAQNGKAVTKLKEKTWAVINWRGEISFDNITKIPGGEIPGKISEKIANEIQAAEVNSEPASLEFVEWFNVNAQEFENI